MSRDDARDMVELWRELRRIDPAAADEIAAKIRAAVNQAGGSPEGLRD